MFSWVPEMIKTAQRDVKNRIDKERLFKKMTNDKMPERIWAYEDKNGYLQANQWDSQIIEDTEYIRADAIAAKDKALDDVLALLKNGILPLYGDVAKAIAQIEAVNHADKKD